MIHFDFDDRYQDELVVGSAISRREGIAWSVAFHATLLMVLLYVPRLEVFERLREAPDQQQLEELARQQQERPSRSAPFVLVDPRLDIPAELLRDRAELSDIDRRSQTRERPETPQNPLPFSRGNSAERVEASTPAAAAPAEAPTPPEPSPAPPDTPTLAEGLPPTVPPREDALPTPPPRDLRNIFREGAREIGRTAQLDTFNNPYGGGTDPGSSIQFDTKGVDFGPWLRRFVIKVRNNWYVPQSAMTFRGHVVVQFHVHRDGTITDLRVVKPAAMESFNRSSFNAITSSNPVDPLPVEYPEDKIFFTVTFYYNEPPPGS